MRRLLGFLALLGALVVGAEAHLRILHPTNKQPLFWQNPGNVSVVIQADGSADVPDDSDRVALELAVAAWNRAPGTVARLALDMDSPVVNTTQWQSTGVHLLWFDETNASGYFPSGTGTVAITPIWFFSDGRISDADVLFNGSGYSFTTSAQPGRFDIQDVATHELGHLLGLDHSGVTGATLYPYVDTTVILHRSLASDDEGGMRAAYPEGNFARLTGRVVRGTGEPVFGAQVVARDSSGRVAGAAVSAADGDFEVLGLSAGSYQVYVAPLEAPVSGSNFTASPELDSDFAPTFLGFPQVLASGQALSLGDVSVLPDVGIQLGRSSDRLPLRGIRGQTTSLSLGGKSLSTGSTLTASAPEIGVQVTGWFGTYVAFQVTVPADAELGHVDLIAQNLSGHRAVLVGGLEITPPNPVVQSIEPALASAAGGALVEINGNHFRPGLSVVLGDRIYPEGEPGGVTWVDSSTLQLTLAATAEGLHDLVVIDSSGVEGRLNAAFQAGLVPSIQSVFPPAGAASGGTEVFLTGSDFAPGLAVRIDGVLQEAISVEASDLVRFETQAGFAPGLYQLETVNPGGEVASAAFVIAAPEDPLLASVEPNSGVSAGGEPVLLTGAHFPVDVEVWFGVDPYTGQGGVEAPSVVRLDAETLEVITPAGSGSAAVVVRSPASGQAGLLTAGFQYTGGQGGGGCVTRPVGPGVDPGGWAPLVGLLLAWLLLGRRPQGRALPSPA